MKVKNIKAFEATKYIILGIIIGFLVTISIIIPVGASIQYTLKESEWKVVVDGVEINDERYPVLILDPGYNYMAVGSLRSVCEKAGIPFEANVPTKQVRISTKQVVENIMVIPTPVATEKEDKPVDVSLIKTINGTQYVRIDNIPNQPKLLPDNYRFERDMVNGKLSDIITFRKKNTETNKWDILIENVPYTKIGHFYIEYDYYIKNVKPLITQ